MCKPEDESSSKEDTKQQQCPVLQDDSSENERSGTMTKNKNNNNDQKQTDGVGNASDDNNNDSDDNMRRGKRVREADLPKLKLSTGNNKTKSKKKRGKGVKSLSRSKSRHEGETQSGGMDALIPSFIAVIVIACGIIAKMGFRGRASVAGIDLGTTNSVICVQQQSKGSEVGEINCIPDPYNNSPIIPSVVSFLDPKIYSKTKSFKKKEELGYDLDPSPSYALVGSAAKKRIDTHPHHTLYHAKRVLGRLYDDDAVKELKEEVEFQVHMQKKENSKDVDANNINGEEEKEQKYGVVFNAPFHSRSLKQLTKEQEEQQQNNVISILPHQVGSYVINHLMEITSQYLGYDNVKSAVIAVPAKFSAQQRQSTVEAFKHVGVKVARILEEPVAAALAYGLQKKENVDYIIVYDFGGGTLDVSVLQVFDGGYVEVIGNDGDNRLGGADFDAAVAHFLMEDNAGYGIKVVNDISKALTELEKAYNDQKDDIEESLVSKCTKLVEMPLCSLSSLHTMGEKMKIELSSISSESGGVVSGKCYGIPSFNTGIASPTSISDFCSMLEPIDFQINIEQYNQACTPLYERSISPVSRILGDLDLSVGEIDEVVMVGGTTRMPQIREMVKEALQIENLNTSIDPDLTVAYGAASVID